jgi:hypothetical protein
MKTTKMNQIFPSIDIYYVLALPDWDPREVTPFQGFAPGLIDFIPLMEFIPTLPADIFDPALSLPDRLGRRRSGSAAWLWTPVNLSTLVAKRKPTPEQPFMVVFSADRKTARAVSNWRNGLRIRPVHLSFFPGGNAIHPAKFSREKLRLHLVALMHKAAELDKNVYIERHLEALSMWKGESRRPSSITFHSHNVTKPNELVLIGADEEPPQDEAGHLIAASAEDYTQGITESAAAVMALWPQTEGRPAHGITAPWPDLILLGPSMYRGIVKRMERAFDKPIIKSALRKLNSQRGYTLSIPVTDENGAPAKADMDAIGPILSMRGAEMKLTSAAVGLRAASSVAATIRLPPAVDRTGGVVSQLARFLRTHENPPPVKAARVFNAVQEALRNAIPAAHLDLIARSKTGIKIIADSPIEWLPVNGLPLGIRYDVSRINTTPGNLFLEQVRSAGPLFIPPDAFRDYLVLSMFDDGDRIAPHLRVGALTALDESRQPIIGKFASPRTVEQFIAAIASFRGPMLIIDSHAEHPEGDVPGGLIISGNRFDVWSLAGKVRMPPIVILSACDTHPFDRSHATVANGFLRCGATAVVATALPIRAPQAARFIMRIINRAVHFGSIMNRAGRAVPWANVVGGVLRMEIATDVVRAFEEKGLYDSARARDLRLQANLDLNPLKPDWYERLKDRVSAACAMPRLVWERELADVIASSDSIRYIHVGNPEAIMVADDRTAGAALEAANAFPG